MAETNQSNQFNNNINSSHIVENLFCPICSSLYKRTLTEN